MQILGRTQMIPNATYEEAVARIMKRGFDGVEINIYNREFKLREEFFKPDFPKEMKKILENYGVTAYSVGAHRDYLGCEEDFKRVKKSISVAETLAAPIVLITGGLLQEGIPYPLQWEKNVEKTKELCQEAEQRGITLALEFEPGFIVDSTEKLLKMIQEIDSPALGMNADIGHIFLQDPDPMKAIGLAGRYIVHAHLENMQKGIHNHLLPQEGDMDMAAYMRKLQEVGFDGYASLDVYQYDYEEIAEEAVAFLKLLMRKEM